MSRVPYLNQLGEALDTAIRTPLPKRRVSWAGPAIAAVAFMLVLAVGTALLLVRDPVDVATPTTLPTTTEAPPAAPLPEAWARVPHTDVLEGLAGAQSLTLTGIDHGPSGYLAVGFEVVRLASDASQVSAPTHRGVLLASDDGVTWRDAGSGVYRSHNTFQTVAIGQDSFALAGHGNDNRARFWLSSDGDTWEPAPIVESGTLTLTVANRLAAIDDGFIAVGYGIEGDGRDATRMGVVWRLAEDGSWIETADPAFSGASLNGLDVNDDAITVTGVIESGDGTSEAAIWRSEDDGSTWTRTVLPRSEVSGFVVVSALAGTTERLVAVGFERADGAVWTSDSGETWERVDDPSGVFATESHTTRIHDVIATDAGFVATGVVSKLSDMRRVTWISGDGSGWTRIDLDEPHVIEGSSTVAYDLATDGETVLAVGGEFTIDDQGAGAVWISPPPAGVEAIGPFVSASEAEPGTYSVAIRPDRGVAITGVDVTVDGDAGSVGVVLVGDDGTRHERCTIDISYSQGRCTFEVGDVAPGSYVVTIDGEDVVEEQPFEVLREGSDVLVLGVTYNMNMWPLVNAVRVENHGANDVDISGWWIEESTDDRFVFPAGTVAKSGKSVIVIQQSTGSRITCRESGSTYFYICPETDSEGWHGAPLYVYNAAGQEIDRWSR